MIKKSISLALLVLALPLTALADGGVTSSLVALVTALPESRALGLLGTGLIGFAVMVRRKLKLAMRRD